MTNHPYWRAALFTWLLLSTLLALGLDPRKDLRQYGHRSWQTDSGLPQNTVHAVLQTRDGYIWLGTEGGLVRFDGAQFVVYDKQAPAHLPSASINSLFEDSNGDLWIGTDDGLVRRRREEFTTFGTANGLPSATIWSVFEEKGRQDQSKRGAAWKLWIATPVALARYQDGRFQSFPIAAGIANAASVAQAADGSFWIGTQSGLVHFGDGVEGARLPTGGNVVQTVAMTADGSIWAGTPAGLYSTGSGKPGNAAPLAGLPSNEITALTAARDGSLWIGTAKGVAVYRGGAIVSYSIGDGHQLDSAVKSISEDREGAMWVATDRGLARIFGDQVQTLGDGGGALGSSVLSIFEDREGSLWLGTESGGLEMLHDQKFSAWTTADGLADNLVRSVLQDRDGVVWTGTNGGGLNRFDHGKFTSLTTADGLSSNIVLALGSDAAGTLWVGTPDGLNRIAAGRPLKLFTSADGLADDFVRSLYAASDGSLWIGTRRGLSHLQNGRFTTYSRMDGLGSDLVGAIVEDRDRSLWIATLGGLTHFASGRFTTLTTRDGLGSNVVTALYQDHQGALWIGTSQGGLNRLRDGKLSNYPPDRTGLPESVYAILEDARGNLWLSSKTGVYSVARQQLNDFADRKSQHLAPTVYGTADGMKIAECSSGGHPAAWKLANGTMWFATLKGIAAVDPEDLTRNAVPPPVAIEQVLIDDQLIDDRRIGDQGIDDQPVGTAAALTVAPGQRRFEFRYAGLSFIAPQKVRFRYKLENFDHDWIEAGTRRTADYTNLPPGKYRFRVLACNNDGVWNENGATLDFRLQPHYYQTAWFYVAVILGLALLAYQIYRWRLRQVELRYDAVLSERGRIAREIHDTLAQSLVGISVQLELVNRLLASSVDTARAQLNHARSLVRDSIAEARSSIWDLRSQAAETEDFATRLAQMAAGATENTTPKIRVKSRVLGTYRPLPPRIQGELLKIAQEAVTNAVRHARPAHIAIELRFNARELQMTIHDDGCGFDGQPHPQSSGPEGHFGLTGMRERAEQIGATLTIDSVPGKGTAIIVHLSIDS